MTYHYKVENEFLIELYNVHIRTCISHSVIRNPWPCSLNIDCKSKWNRLWASNEVLIHDIDQANCHYKIWIERWKWLIKILNLFYNSILTKMIAASPFFSDCKLIVHVLQNSNLSNYHIIPIKYPGYFEWKRGIFIEFTLISGHWNVQNK